MHTLTLLIQIIICLVGPIISATIYTKFGKKGLMCLILFNILLNIGLYYYL